MSETVCMANTIFIDLKENVASFEKEAYFIDEMKCHLMNYGNLDDFEYEDAQIDLIDNGYHIYFDGVEMDIEVEDKMIVNLKYC